MDTTLDIKSIQYLNLFSFITGINALDCFEYNSSVIFVIKDNLINQVLSNNGEKIRKFVNRTNRNVKVVSLPDDKGLKNMEKFILSVIYPVKFKRLSISHEELIINASPEIKARLIGRNSIRLIELNSIVKKYFDVRKIVVR